MSIQTSAVECDLGSLKFSYVERFAGLLIPFTDLMQEEQSASNATEVTDNGPGSRPSLPNEILATVLHAADVLLVEAKADLLANSRLQLCAILLLRGGCCSLWQHFLEPRPKNVSIHSPLHFINLTKSRPILAVLSSADL